MNEEVQYQPAVCNSPDSAGLHSGLPDPRYRNEIRNINSDDHTVYATSSVFNDKNALELEIRRRRNRIAQRNYRKSLEARLEALRRNEVPESSENEDRIAPDEPPSASSPDGGEAAQRRNSLNLVDQNPPCNTLYVGNLPVDASEEELKLLFMPQIGFKRMCFRTKQNGPMCFVEFDDTQSATEALQHSQGYRLSSSAKEGIRLSYSKTPLGFRSGGIANKYLALLPQAQSDESFKIICCVCGNTENDYDLLQCEQCGTWQHIVCYHVLNGCTEEIAEVHECITCSFKPPQPPSDDVLSRLMIRSLTLCTSAVIGTAIGVAGLGTGLALPFAMGAAIPVITTLIGGYIGTATPSSDPPNTRSNMRLASVTAQPIVLNRPESRVEEQRKLLMKEREREWERMIKNLEEQRKLLMKDREREWERMNKKLEEQTRNEWKEQEKKHGERTKISEEQMIFFEEIQKHLEILRIQGASSVGKTERFPAQAPRKLSAESDSHNEIGFIPPQIGQARLLKEPISQPDIFQSDKTSLKGQLYKMSSIKENNQTACPCGCALQGGLYSQMFPQLNSILEKDWRLVQSQLPEEWKWDAEYNSGCWTYTPLETTKQSHYPLTIAGAPVVLPMEYQWPPMSGVNPPPDPRPASPINCRAELTLDVVRDIFLTFDGIIGFYLLINGLLQIIVPEDFDTSWASSHQPHKYGGLKVCYIRQTLEPTMRSISTQVVKTEPPVSSSVPSAANVQGLGHSSHIPISYSLKLNDYVEARPKRKSKEKYSGRIGLKVVKDSDPYLVMSTHVITEAILAKSLIDSLFWFTRGRFERLTSDWNDHVDMWAGNKIIGTIEKSFDNGIENYPNGFNHDVTLLKAMAPASIQDIASPISNMGWLNHSSWSSLRQQTSVVKILAPTENHRAGKSLKCSRLSEILVVGEGIFLNQKAALGSTKNLKDHDVSAWRDLVSRAVLYRVFPDFDPPNGYSGIALYADGTREDGTEGPGIVGFQSFVQRSGHVQNFEMEGVPLEQRLKLGRVAFYGAFEVPAELKEYTIV